MKNAIMLAALAAAVFLVMGCGGGEQSVQSGMLPRSTPEEQGMDSAEIVNMINRMQQDGARLNGFLVMRHGFVVAEGYFHPCVREYRQQIGGVTGTVLAGVTGIALEEEIVKSLDDKMIGYLDEDIEYENPSPRKKEITIRQLLTHASGIAWDGRRLDEKNSQYQMQLTENYLQYFLDQPSRYAPGSEFNLSAGDTQALAAVIQTAADQPVYDFARLKLFEPLGITDAYWYKDIEGVNFSGGLSLSLTDLAKIGLLYLRKGTWEDKQVIPSAWIEESLKSQVNAGERGAYGYGWFSDGAGTYSSIAGTGGQSLVLVPESDLVVVFGGMLKPEEAARDLPYVWTNEYLKKAIAAKGGAAGKPDADTEALKKKIGEIAAAPQAGPVPALPDIAKKIEGKNLRCKDSTLLKFFFDAASDCRIESYFQGLKNVFRVGLDGNYRVNKMEGWPPRDPVDRYLAAMKGGWMNDRTFVLNQVNLGGLADIEMTIILGENDFELVTRVTSIWNGQTVETKQPGEILWNE